MRIFALELNNEIKGIAQRKEYIESLIAGLPSPDFVVLPELALCSYMASREIFLWSRYCERELVFPTVHIKTGHKSGYKGI